MKVIEGATHTQTCAKVPATSAPPVLSARSDWCSHGGLFRQSLVWCRLLAGAEVYSFRRGFSAELGSVVLLRGKVSKRVLCADENARRSHGIQCLNSRPHRNGNFGRRVFIFLSSIYLVLHMPKPYLNFNLRCMFLCPTSEVPIVFLVAFSLPPVPRILWSACTVLDHSRYLEVWSVGRRRETVPWMFCFVSGDVIVRRCVAMLVPATCSACRLVCVSVCNLTRMLSSPAEKKRGHCPANPQSR